MTRSGRVCWFRSPLPSWRLPFFSILHTSRHTLRPHIKDNGSGGGGLTASFSLPFWRRWKTQRPGGGGGARSALKSRGGGFASGPRFFVWQARGPLGPRAAKRRRPLCPPRPSCVPRATAIGPPEVHRRGGGGRRWGARGRRRFVAWGPKGSQATKPTQGRGPRPPAPALCALCAPAAPPGRCGFLPAKRAIRHPFPPRLPTNKTSPPLPMSGGPAYFAGKPKKFSSWFSPAFFKSGRGAEPSAASGGKSEAEAQ